MGIRSKPSGRDARTVLPARTAVSAAVCLALYGVPHWAAAQQQAPAQAAGSTTELSEITVTATRREATIESVPYSLSVVSGEDLARAGVTDFASLASQVPGLAFYDFGGRQVGGEVPIIRGLNASDVQVQNRSFRTFEQSPVGTYIGNSPFEGAGSLELDDIQRVEVLRGPQGTLRRRRRPRWRAALHSELPAARRLRRQHQCERGIRRWGGQDGLHDLRDRQRAGGRYARAARVGEVCLRARLDRRLRSPQAHRLAAVRRPGARRSLRRDEQPRHLLQQAQLERPEQLHRAREPALEAERCVQRRPSRRLRDLERRRRPVRRSDLPGRPVCGRSENHVSRRQRAHDLQCHRSAVLAAHVALEHRLELRRGLCHAVLDQHLLGDERLDDVGRYVSVRRAQRIPCQQLL